MKSSNVIKGGLILLLLLCGYKYTSAQVEVIADGRLQTILEKHVEYNRMTKNVRGFRIKVASFTSDGSKTRAFNLKKELQNAFPQQRVYVVFDEPYFNVKLGDYPSRLDAYADFIQIKAQISTALIIQDYINPPVINEEDLQLPEYFEEELE